VKHHIGMAKIVEIVERVEGVEIVERVEGGEVLF
jgi:hypothetical protein